MLGSRIVARARGAGRATPVTFTVAERSPGTFPLRLRVGGVDSRLIADRTRPMPAFDPDKRVTVT